LDNLRAQQIKIEQLSIKKVNSKLTCNSLEICPISSFVAFLICDKSLATEGEESVISAIFVLMNPTIKRKVRPDKETVSESS